MASVSTKAAVGLLAAALAVTAAACGGSGAKPPENQTAPVEPAPAKPPEPVTLNFLYSSNIATFEERYAEPVRKKFPHITMKLVTMSIADALASNTPVDILFNSLTVSGQYVDAKLTTDMTELAKKHKSDLNRFHPELLETIRQIDDGKLSGLPQKNIGLVLFYNKDLFDKFGVAYPKNGMTWEETAELAVKLTRNDGGVQYRGFAGSLARMLGQNQYSIPLVDPKTNIVDYSGNAQWNKILQAYAPLFTMSGYNPTEQLLSDAEQTNLFRKEKTAAMWVTDSSNFPPEADNVNWDAVSAPDFADRKGAGPVSVPTIYFLSSTSKHPDEAFQVIDYLTMSEMQEYYAKVSLAAPSIKDPKAVAAFGEGNTALQGKNLKPFTPDKVTAAPTFGNYYTISRTPLLNGVIAHIAGKKDINTALRDATEEANKAVQTRISATK